MKIETLYKIVLTYVYTYYIIEDINLLSNSKGECDMKTTKSFRFSNETIKYLKKLKENFDFTSETEIIEKAVKRYANTLLEKEDLKEIEFKDISF